MENPNSWTELHWKIAGLVEDIYDYLNPEILLKLHKLLEENNIKASEQELEDEITLYVDSVKSGIYGLSLQSYLINKFSK